MNLVDFILNIAGLLLWLGWRSTRFDPLVRTSVSSLAATLRRAEPRRRKGRQLLAFLAGLLLVRAWFYWQVGEAASWSAQLDLGAVVPTFRPTSFGAALLFSALSLGRVLVLFYFWLLFLVMFDRRVLDSDPVQRMFRLHVGRAAAWPWPLQFLAFPVLAAVLWFALHPLLLYYGVTSRVSSNLHLMTQGCLVGGSLYLSLKFLIPALLLLHVVASYVYLGASPFWDFLSSTTRSVLKPLRWMPLRAGRWDFAPLVGVVLILLLLHVLPLLIARELSNRHLTLWPQ
jgi:uncharacterized protein YggT (Ycf19 family)